jgi:hypothetical protein
MARMDLTDDERLDRATAASDAGLTAEVFRLLSPPAESGHPKAMAWVGSLLSVGAHRHETWASLEAAPPEEPAVMAADRALAARYLQAASDAGVGPASFNLAGLAITANGFGTWEERRANAEALYALAHAQGFTAFGPLTNQGDGGQPYLDDIEGYALTSGHLLPGMSVPPPSSATAAESRPTGQS